MQINGVAVNGNAVNGDFGGIELQAFLTLSISSSAGIDISKPLSATAAIAATSSANLSLEKPLSADVAQVSASSAADLRLTKSLAAQLSLSASVTSSALVFLYEEWRRKDRRAFVEVEDSDASVPVHDRSMDVPQLTTAYVPTDSREV